MNIQSVGLTLPIQGNAETSSVPRETRSTTQTQAPQGNSQPVSQQQLDAAIKSVQDYVKPFNNDLQFSVNNDTKQVVVKVVDSETKEVIRQIPSEEMVAIAKALDSLQGLLLRQKA